MLYNCYALAAEDKDFSRELGLIRERYEEIIDGLSLKLSLDQEFAVIEKNFKAHAGRGLCGVAGRIFKRHRDGGVSGLCLCGRGGGRVF